LSDIAAQPGTAPLDSSAFDFLPGKWSVAMRRRKVDGKLNLLSDWVVFSARASFERVLDGKAVFGQYEMHQPDGMLHAIDLRIFNPQTNGWTIYWASSNDHEWQENPMRGGVATPNAMIFTMEDALDGCPVLTRFIWRVASQDHAIWEQSFSNDDGKTWISNWEMRFTRDP
jgi:hypothetical protein